MNLSGKKGASPRKATKSAKASKAKVTEEAKEELVEEAGIPAEESSEEKKPPKAKKAQKGKMSKGSKAKSTKKVKRGETSGQDGDADEVVTTQTELPEESGTKSTTPPEVTPVKAFQGGFVAKALTGAVNAHWGRTEETAIFAAVMYEKHMVDGVYIGDIVVRPSFVKRSKGSALM